MALIKQKIGQIFKRFKLEEIEISAESAGVTISYTNWDAEAAWQLYVELLTRITTQPLEDDFGDEQAALESVHKLFEITRDVLKKYGKNAKAFTRIAIIVLNKKIRPFTAKCHKKSLEKCFNVETEKSTFRKELKSLRIVLIKYAKLLAEMAKVDDLTEFDE